MPEPGRRIVAEELDGAGRALPWVDLQAFAQRAVEMARADLLEARKAEGVVFFDRGLIDAAVALEFTGGPSVDRILGRQRPYAKRVFVAPPWPEIFRTDAARQHDLDAAEEEYERITAALDQLGYEIRHLPRVSVGARAEIVMREIDAP